MGRRLTYRALIGQDDALVHDASVEGDDGMGDPKPARTPTAYERFVAATRQVLSVSKAELEKREKGVARAATANARAAPIIIVM